MGCCQNLASRALVKAFCKARDEHERLPVRIRNREIVTLRIGILDHTDRPLPTDEVFT